MVQRYAAAWGLLNCPTELGLATAPITALFNANMVCNGAVFNFAQNAANGACTPTTVMSTSVATALPQGVGTAAAAAAAAPTATAKNASVSAVSQ